WIGAMGMTEPSAGTDVLGMRSTARQDGDHFVLKGHKALITNAPEASVFLVYAKIVGHEDARFDGKITSFILERGMSGLSTPDKTHKMGMRASSLGEIVMDE